MPDETLALGAAAERKQSSAAFAAMKDDLETENRKLSKHVIQVERWQRAMDTNHMLVEDFSHQLHRSRQNSANVRFVAAHALPAPCRGPDLSGRHRSGYSRAGAADHPGAGGA